jgi:hypothetical protein
MRVSFRWILPALALLAGPRLIAQTSGGDSVRAMRDTIVVIGTRSSILPPAGVMSARDLFSSPGGFHDPLRAVSLLPYAAIASDIQAQPTIGGDDPDRVLMLLDGFEIAAPYRFLGTFSVFNPLMMRNINATTTGYPVRYGGFFPSAVEVQSEDGYVERTGVRAELTPPISQLAIGVPLDSSAGLSVRLGLRTSHLSLIRPVLAAFAGDHRLDGFLPSLRDAQWGITFAPSRGLNVRQRGILADETGSLQSFERTFSYAWARIFQGLTVVWHPDEKWTSTTRISLQNNDVDLSSEFPLESLGDQRFAMTSSFRQGTVATEAAVDLDETIALLGGAEVSRKASAQAFLASSAYLRVPRAVRTSFTEAAFFAQAQVAVGDRLVLTLGERLWYSGSIGRGGNESRVTVGLQLSGSARCEAGYGEYSQVPSDMQVLYGYLSLLAEPNQPPRLLMMSQSTTPLAPEESRVLFARAHQIFLATPSLSGTVTAEAYTKTETAVIMSQRYPSVFTPLDSNSFQPSQRFGGRKWGIGVSLLVVDAASGLSGTASYARQSSIVQDMILKAEIPAGSDRHDLLKAMIRYEHGGWNAAVTYQYYGGSPTTDRYFLASTGIFGNSFYVPVWRDLNGNRLPAYSRLDLFIGRIVQVDSWEVTPYVDIVNVLNTENISSYNYALEESRPPDYTRKTPANNSLPLFPTIGVRLAKEW